MDTHVRALLALVLPVVLLATGQALAQSERDTKFELQLSEARGLIGAGKLDDAVDAFKKANKLAKGKSAECYLGMSLAQFRQREFKDAYKSAEKGLEHASNEAERAKAHYYVGSSLMALDDGNGKKLAESEPSLRAAIDIEPDNATYAYQLGVALLRMRRDAAGIADHQRYLELFPRSMRAQEVQGFIDYPPRAHRDYAPEFHLEAAGGEEISLENQRGRVLVIDFWATWCPPCVDALPDLRKLHEKLTDAPFTLLSISVDQDLEAWKNFVVEEEMKWPQFHDAKDDIVKQFLPARFSIPRYVLIDPEGIVRGSFGGDGRALSRLRKKIDEMLEELDW